MGNNSIFVVKQHFLKSVNMSKLFMLHYKRLTKQKRLRLGNAFVEGLCLQCVDRRLILFLPFP